MQLEYGVKLMRRKIVLKIEKKALVEYIFIFLILVPPILQYVDSATLIFSILNVAKILLGLYYFYVGIRKHQTKLFLTALLYTSYIFLITLICSGSIRYYAQFFISIIAGIVFGYEASADTKTINRLYKYLLLLSSVNFLMMLLYPNGVLQTNKEGTIADIKIWLLGNTNTATPFLLLATIICFIMLADNKKNIWPYIGIVCSSGGIYLGSAATGKLSITVVLLICVVFVFFEGITHRFRVNPLVYIAVVIVACVFLVVINDSAIFRTIIVDILKKDLTLTGRFTIWERTKYCIAQRPLFGYGIQSTEWMNTHILATHCHDYYLNIVLDGGIIGFSLWLSMIIQTFKSLKVTDYCIKSKLIAAGIFGLMLSLITEAFNYRYMGPFFILLGLGDSVKQLIVEPQKISER